MQAAREAGFDVLIACAFHASHAAGFTKLRRILVLKARMNADLHSRRQSDERKAVVLTTFDLQVNPRHRG